jgi:glutamate racemase
MKPYTPIGVFDSGFGGLTVLKEIVNRLPQYDYVYIGDNARTPYGNRSFETVYEYTLQAVKTFFEMGCELVIIACNTASAKALRTIQQKDLPLLGPNKRVLGVIRPSVEEIGNYSKTRHIGILGTPGTVNSQSYVIEINNHFPDIKVVQEACAIWVPLIENNQFDNPGGAYFIQHHLNQLLSQDSKIDTIILGCTHYPIIAEHIKQYIPKNITVLSQGKLVAEKLADYLTRHKNLAEKCSEGGTVHYFTTDNPSIFDERATIFVGKPINSERITLVK